jgi:hypothetical protein
MVGTNCNANNHGSVDCGGLSKVDATTPEACKKKCEDLGKCAGVTIGLEPFSCVPHLQIDLHNCEKNASYNTSVISGRAATTATTTTSGQPHTWKPAAEVAKDMNALYNTIDNGVLIHMIDGGPVYDSGGDRMSFCMMNNGTWGNVIYRNGQQPTIIAAPETNSIISCIFPCDGNSASRTNKGCGQGICGAAPTVPCGNECASEDENGDWCGYNVTLETIRGEKDFRTTCALHGDQLKEAFQFQSALHQGQKPIADYCTQHPYGGTHNEAIIDGEGWTARLPQGLWAFSITNSCGPDCVTQTLAARDEFMQKYNVKDVPIINVDLGNIQAPFSAHSLSSEHTKVVV